MAESGTQQVKVAVNVMRSRLTVIGFNIAVASFQLARINELPGGQPVSGVDHLVHAGVMTALLLAMALSIIAMVVYLLSGSMDPVGVCNHWSLVAGDLLMYLALASTVSGFFAPLGLSIDILAANWPQKAAQIAILHTGLLAVGGLGWFFAAYVGPSVSILRSPFSSQVNFRLLLAYAAVMLFLSWLHAHATLIDDVSNPEFSLALFLFELIQPFRW
ncbi:hypothetical protein [Corallincola spongiicola]|uniref:Uncharacterized protein n=1 Tax=Corallincola spongiicola TaxID=2520508 RepID=A0ABY1WSH7_9GAMM|nr:hypothetical protein [Corallincola spongiicola]TAA47685.1 hypothetical protein EXY25_00075 [Corallincola spongiicola]